MAHRNSAAEAGGSRPTGHPEAARQLNHWQAQPALERTQAGVQASTADAPAVHMFSTTYPPVKHHI